MRRWVVLVVVAAVMVGGTACSGSDDDSAARTADDSLDGAAVGGEGGQGVAVVPVGQPLTAGRSIISTASVRVSVDDVEVAARRAVDAASVAGGFLAAQQARLGEREIQVTLRVPSARFQQVVGDVSDLGEVEESDVDTQDLTEEVVDLESRITSGRASVERVRGLLERAGDVAQLAAVEGELARREADLESLLGRLRVLEDQVDLSTIDARLTEDDAGVSDDLPGLVEAAGSGWDAFLGAARVVLAGVGYVLPFATLALAVGVAVVAVRRRRPAGAG